MFLVYQDLYLKPYIRKCWHEVRHFENYTLLDHMITYKYVKNVKS